MKNLGRFILLLYEVVPAILLHAQPVGIPRDTSFTVSGTYSKEVKKFPFIRIADPALASGVSVDSNNVYAEPGGRPLTLDIFSPTKIKSGVYPLVLMILGGGWRACDRTQCYPIAKQLAAKGYISVAAEYRLSPEAPYPARMEDLKAAIRFLRGNAKKYGALAGPGGHAYSSQGSGIDFGNDCINKLIRLSTNQPEPY